MSVLWTSDAAALATGGTSTRDWQATGVSIDTRSIAPGELFVALKDVRDGHDFVAQALDKGAAAALVTHRPEGVAEDAPLLIVDDVLRALEDLGRAARARTHAGVIGVTGSVGKTGTKEMLRTALTAQGKVHAAERSFNNHWGVPLTLARMPENTDFAVIEIGMNAPGEIGPLARMADLDVAIITTVAAVHMAAFEDVTGIAHEKAAIFDGLRKGGTAIINADIETTGLLAEAASDAHLQRFGESGAADLRLSEVGISGNTTTVQAHLHDTPILFKIGAPGRHLAMNALAALLAVEAAGADMARAMLALGDWHAPSGRGQREYIRLGTGDGEQLELIDESYNANPTSMAAALEVLAASQPTDNVGTHAGGRRIAALGDMLELGPQSADMHAALAGLAAMEQIDQVHTCGPMMAALHAALPPLRQGQHFESSTQMAASVHRLVDAGDVIMLKGSLGSAMAKVVSGLKALEQGA